MLFKDQVAPRFGACRSLLLADIEDGHESGREIADLGEIFPEELPADLAARGVNAVICGGIHPRFGFALEAQGIEVLSGHTGDADTALHRLAAGHLGEGDATCRPPHACAMGRGTGRGHGRGDGRGRGQGRGQGRGRGVGRGRGRRRGPGPGSKTKGGGSVDDAEE
jgi:predicted Fe-Mo cluster-binding NifX family protein